MRQNTENLVGHIVPFPMTLKSLLWSTLLGIVSKDSVRQDHKTRGYARFSQTTAIRHSWFRYKYSKIETGNTGPSPFVVRWSALSHIPFPFLVMHEFRVATSNSNATICIQSYGLLSNSSPVFFTWKKERTVGGRRESYVACWSMSCWRGLRGRICHIAESGHDRPCCCLLTPQVGPFRGR